MTMAQNGVTIKKFEFHANHESSPTKTMMISGRIDIQRVNMTHNAAEFRAGDLAFWSAAASQRWILLAQDQDEQHNRILSMASGSNNGSTESFTVSRIEI